MKFCTAKQPFSGLLVIKFNHFGAESILFFFFLEAGTLLIKMWAPKHFSRGKLS